MHTSPNILRSIVLSDAYASTNSVKEGVMKDFVMKRGFSREERSIYMYVIENI